MEKSMHCPRCGHQQNSDEIRFCTKCGLEIGDVKELLAPELRKTEAERKNEIKKARKQGMIVMYISFAVIILFAALRDYYPIPRLFAFVALFFMVGGAFRMAMPTLFSRDDRRKESDESPDNEIESKNFAENIGPERSLPEGEYRPPLDLETSSFDTNDLVPAASVTENTTRKLKKKLRQD